MADPDIETYRALTTALKAIEGLAPTLREALTVGLPSIQARLGAALASRDPEMFKAVFEELYAFAESELGDGEFLAMLRPYIVPILGAAGATEAGVGGVSTAFTAISALGAATAEMMAVLAPMIFWPAAAAVVAILLFYLYKLADDATRPKFTPQPMETPHWEKIFGALNHPNYGPITVVNRKRSRPIGLRLA